MVTGLSLAAVALAHRIWGNSLVLNRAPSGWILVCVGGLNVLKRKLHYHDLDNREQAVFVRHLLFFRHQAFI